MPIVIRTARRIVIKPILPPTYSPALLLPLASARLFSSRDSLVHCPDHRQPSSRRSTDIGPGSPCGLIRYNPASRIGILAGRNLHVCAITKATSSAYRALPPAPSQPPSSSLTISSPCYTLLFRSPLHILRESSIPRSILSPISSLFAGCLSPTRYLLLCKAARSA